MILSCSKKLSAFFRRITSKHHSDFYYFSFLHSFVTKKKYESSKKVCGNKHFCNIILLSEDTEILEINQYQKSHKAPIIIYVDIESLIEKIDECKNNPEKSSTTKLGEYI